MSGAFGLALVVATGIALMTTGLPAFLVILAMATMGAAAATLAGAVDPAIFGALPNRVISLLESDLLQALPLYVLMGTLLNRLPLASALFRTAVSLAPASRAAPAMAAIGLGALLGPMNGSVGASVMVLARVLAPRLAASGVPGPLAGALVAAASTLGVVIPPSLVLILLGEAMMAAHTLAANATGMSVRIVNTQDIFRGALVPAAAFVALSLVASWWSARRGAPPAERAGGDADSRPSAIDIALSMATSVFVVGLLAGVAAGWFYAVEAASMGAMTLLAAAAAGGRLSGGALGEILREAIAATGALFALLVAATTLTLLLRALGTDRLAAELLAALPGGPAIATLVVLAIVAACALVLDAFEIVFVVLPIVAPPLLQRAPDAVWVAVLLLLVLQASFMAPPFGYALALVRGAMEEAGPPRALHAAMVPFLAAQAVVVAAVLAFPQSVHWTAPRGAEALSVAPRLGDEDVARRFRELSAPVEEGDDAQPAPVFVAPSR